MNRLLALALWLSILLIGCGSSTASAPTATLAASPVCSCSLSSGEQVVPASDGSGASVISHAGTCTTPCQPNLKSLLSIKSIDPNAAPPSGLTAEQKNKIATHGTVHAIAVITPEAVSWSPPLTVVFQLDAPALGDNFPYPIYRWDGSDWIPNRNPAIAKAKLDLTATGEVDHTSLFVLVSGPSTAVTPSTATPQPTATRKPTATPTRTSTPTLTPMPSSTPTITSTPVVAPFVAATINVGLGPYGIAVDQSTNRIYAVNSGGQLPINSIASRSVVTKPNTISVIDGSSDSIIQTLPAGTGPLSIGVNATTSRIYLVSTADHIVTAVDLNGRTEIQLHMDPISGFWGVAVSPKDHRVYVPVGVLGLIFAIDDSQNSLIDEFQFPNTRANGGIAINLGTGLLYTTSLDSSFVSVIDPATRSVVQQIKVRGGSTGIAVDPTANRIYVADAADNSVSVIDGAANQVTATISVGKSPTGIAIDPTTQHVFVSNSGSDTVSVIDEATNTVVETVKVGSLPVAVAANPATHRAYIADYGRQSNAVSVIQDVAPGNGV